MHNYATIIHLYLLHVHNIPMITELIGPSPSLFDAKIDTTRLLATKKQETGNDVTQTPSRHEETAIDTEPHVTSGSDTVKFIVK